MSDTTAPSPDHEVYESHGGAPIHAWVRGVPFEPEARKQLENISRLPVVFHHVAAMPDVHLGMGATVGSVLPTLGAIIPAAVGVDIGCGMMAVRTSLTAEDLPDDLKVLRRAIEKACPHGRTNHGRKGDLGAWKRPPATVERAWGRLERDYQRIIDGHPRIDRNAHPAKHLGTLGTGNHFIEVCLDEEDTVWFMLHSGSRGVGARIGTHFVQVARRDMGRHVANLPDRDLAYLEEGSEHFADYVHAVGWAQDYARTNRDLMMQHLVDGLRRTGALPQFRADREAVNCHHNYVSRETHYGTEGVLVTRKGAIRAREGELGIIPGSMGARSFLVRGKGNPESFHSCSHGAGRRMSRREAKRRFTLDDHARATRDVECRKDEGVLDETPGAYKPIERVMAAQEGLVEVVHTLRQIVCVKG